MHNLHLFLFTVFSVSMHAFPLLHLQLLTVITFSVMLLLQFKIHCKDNSTLCVFSFHGIHC